jgi:transcriptional antiterminator NusG
VPGATVRITEGPFENFEAVVDEVMAGKGLVRVMVNIYGRPTPLELEPWEVE